MEHGEARKTRLLVFMLIAVCTLLGIGVLLNIVVVTVHMATVLDDIVSGQHDILSVFLLLLNARNVLDVLIFICFVAFTGSIVRNRRFFSRRQSILLLVIGCLYLAHVLIGLCLPELSISYVSSMPFSSEKVSPSLDLRMLSFSLMFFVFAGVFEYGRILQEDSDDIL